MRRRGTRPGRWRVPALLALILLAFLAGCADSTSGVANTPPPSGNTPPAADASLTATEGPTPTPTLAQIGAPGGQGGAGLDCTSGASVSQPLPASILPYPRAVERLYQSADTNKLWGFCSSDGVGAVGDFYRQQLAAKGWQKLTDSTFGTIRQLLGFQGTSASVVITIQPDAKLAGTTDIVISTSGL